MKKLLNEPANIVKESLAGLAAAHGDLVRYDAAPRSSSAPDSGQGGADLGRRLRHEPMHGELVGPGMFDAECPGEGTPPVPEQMLAATKAVDADKGVVTSSRRDGNMMDFQLAAKDVKDEGKVESVLIDEDVADRTCSPPRVVAASGHRPGGEDRGAAAERGDELGHRGRARTEGERGPRSYGVALSACTASVRHAIFDLPEGRSKSATASRAEPV